MPQKLQIQKPSLETRTLFLEYFCTVGFICSEESQCNQNIAQLTVQREVTGSLSLFSSQITAIERAQAELLEVVEMSRRAAGHQADALTRQLELEVKELCRKETVLDELTQSEDSMQCLMVSETCWLQNITLASCCL